MKTANAKRVIDRRTLNRTTLARQWLLRRAERPALDAVRHLVALQAQATASPYIGLWTRLATFARDDLTRALYDRAVVRSSMLRGTQHIAAADDFLWLRPMVRPALDRGRQAAYGRQTAGIDLDELAALTRSLLTGRTLTRARLGALLAERWPGRDGGALGWTAQAVVPVIHEPPSGTWGRGGATPFTLAEEWIGAPMDDDRPVAELIRRYLAAFGPASVRDFQIWSGLRRMDAAFARLRPALTVYADEAGQELFDLPDLPPADPAEPAPVRFLPEYDDLIVAYADRTRLMSAEDRKRVCVGSLVKATVLVDGRVRGVWKVSREGATAVLTIEEFALIAGRDAVAEEGARLLRFCEPGADRHVVRYAGDHQWAGRASAGGSRVA
ncbi:winged helix DNA-binding domain-containing protein [Spongiactinospora sp. 9N601]|uniref:winged helix DNA-binding domain-containing protein n=1 Tax=Spongiactinospora sp. 9N601 TaxID=3375149 RepID=UPI0037A287EE